MVKRIFPQSGFTLLELMIVVVVVGILAAIALPSYQDHVRRTSLQQAFADLADQRIRMEQFYQNNLRYGTIGSGCGHDGVAQRVNFTGEGDFTYQCALSVNGVASNQGYMITATATSGRAAGHTYTLNHNNGRGTTRFKGASKNSSCWLVRGDEC